MIGIIPSASSTYEVLGDFNSDDKIEGKIYYRPTDKRLFYYSTTLRRSNPKSGYFPIWNGKDIFISNFSNEKYFDKDVLTQDILSLTSSIDNNVAEKVIRNQRLSENNTKLKPRINDSDNLFTQVIKGTICALDITKVDLIDNASKLIPEKIIEGYYNSLSKVTMMRFDKFSIWVDKILHVGYELEILKNDEKIISYEWPSNTFDTGIIKYDSIVRENDDPFKKIMKIIMFKENISKSDIKDDSVDDYTINNMMTTLHGQKPMSAQIFCRFIRLVNMSIILKIVKDQKVIFTYTE